MKIKTIISTLVVVSILLLATACGLSEQEQGYIETARAAAENISMPTYYCPHHGTAYELVGDIKCSLEAYSLSTGELIVRITQAVECPEANGWDLACSGWGTEIYAYFLVAESEAKTEYTILLNELLDDAFTKVWRCGP